MRRLLGFAVLPGFSLLASLALLPMIAARYGADGWSSLAIGQSIGAIVGVFVGMAWWTIGGNAIAAAPDDATRRGIFRSSITSRGLVLVALAPLGAVAAWLLAPAYPAESALFMLGIALNGMSASWYFAGIGRPGRLVLNEGVVRLAGYVVSVVGVLAGLGLWWYAIVMLAAGVVMLILNWVTVMGPQRAHAQRRVASQRPDALEGPTALPAPSAPSRAATPPKSVVSRVGAEAVDAWRVIRSQANGTSARALSAAFWYGNLSLFSLFAPGSIGAFSAVHQLQRTANNALDTVAFSFMSWAGSARSAGESARRRGRLLVLIGAVALAVFAAWALAGPLIVQVLYAGLVTFTPTETLLIGAVIALFLVMNATELLVMVPAELQRRVFAVNQITSVAGLALLALLAPALGVLGGLLALVAVPLASCAVYAWCIVRLPRAATPMHRLVERTG